MKVGLLAQPFLINRTEPYSGGGMAFSAFSTTPSILTQTVGGPVIDKNYTVSPGHTFALGEAIYLGSSGELLKAKADALGTSYTIGVVKGLDANTITIGYQGEFTVDASTTGYFPLVTGNVYYLSPTIPGGITATSPSSSSLVVQPLMVAKDSYTAIVVNSIPRQNFGFTSLYTPVGTLVPFGGKANNVPGNWLLCAGDVLAKGTTSTDTYYDLYSAIGEKYGVSGLAKAGSTGTYAYINFNSGVEDAPSYGSGLPGSTKNFSMAVDDVYKITWGSNQAVAKVSTASGLTSNVTFQFLAGITGATSEFSGLYEATEVTINSLVPGEAAGYTSNSFFLPDLRGRMVVGAGQGVNLTNRPVGSVGGEETHTLTNSELPSHRHTVPLRNSSGISGSAQYVLGGATGSVNAVLSTDLQTNSAVTDLTGGGQAHQNMPPYLATNWLIRYKSNIGQPGIEPGPKGDQGIPGATGGVGSTGVQGATGATGYASGVVTYRYTPLATPPNGYWTETSGYLTVSSLEDTNANLSAYIETWDDSNATNKGVVFIRDAYNSPTFFRIYNVTGSPVTGNAGPYTYYTFPVSTIVSSGTGASGSRYNVLFIPSGNDGTNGVNGSTGEKGDTGAQGNTGPQGATGIDGTCGCPSFVPPQNPTMFIDPNSTNTDASIKYAPFNFSAVSSEPTSFDYFKSSIIAPVDYTFDGFSEIVLPKGIDVTNIVKYNFDYSATGGTPCDGNCVGMTSYYNLSDSVRLFNSSVPPSKINIVLSANAVYSVDKPFVVKDSAISVYAQSGAYFTKTPTGLSAGYANGTTGSTGRGYLNIELYGDTNNVVIGNYVGIKPEYFSITGSASVTGYQTLCGIYRVNDVDYDNDIIRVQARILTGSGTTGARMFTGSLSYPQFGQFDVYTTSVEFQDCNGFMVEPTGTLSLGTPNSAGASGSPFVIIHAGSATGGQYAKGVYVAGGKAYLGNSMALLSWPAYGAALYATNAGLINGVGVLGSNNGTFTYAEAGSTIYLSYPIVSRNDNGIILDGASRLTINGSNNGNNRRFLSVNNATNSMILNSAALNILDQQPQIILDGTQTGLLVNRASFVIQGSSGSDGAIIQGYTGIAGVRGVSLNLASSATLEIATGTFRSSVTGNSILAATKKTGTITSIYVAPSGAGSNLGDKFPGQQQPPAEGN